MSVPQFVQYPTPAGAGAANASVGLNGVTAPLSSTEIGFINGSGNETGVSPSTPLPVTDSGSEATLTAIEANQTNGTQETQIVQGGNTAIVTVAGAQKVDGSAVTQPVSAASLPLPAGAATSANQTNGNQVTQVSNFPATQPISGTVTSNQGTPGATAWPVDGSGVTQPVSAASLPLPTGAASAANQTNGSQETQIVQGGNTAIVTVAGAQKVDGSAVTQPVSATALPLPANAAQETGGNLDAINTNTAASATSANQTNGTQKSQISTPAPLTITQSSITVGTSAVRLTVSGSAPASTRVVLVVTPDSAATGKFYIGSSTVTSSGSTRGVQIVAGQIFIANSDAGDYWIVSDTASQTVELMEQA